MIRKLLLAVIRRVLPPPDRDAILGDVDESYARLAATSPARAHLWLAREVCATVAAALADVSRSIAARRRWRPRGLELRHAFRRLAHAPGFTLLAVLTLAVGIGASTAIFGLLYDVLLRPLPVPRPHELFLVEVAGPDRGDAVSYPEFRALQAARADASFAATTGFDHTLVDTGVSRRYLTADFVDGRFFEVLGLRPAIGRLITPADEATAARVVVVSARFWERDLGRDPHVIGRALTLGRSQFVVVGVAPPTFRGIAYPGWFEIAAPISTTQTAGLPDLSRFGEQTVSAIARVSGAIGPAEAAASAAVQACCATRDRLSARFTSIRRGIEGGKDDLRPELKTVLTALLIAVGAVFLIACANVASLLMIRGAGRAREIAVRVSLGATRGRVLLASLAESTLLAAVAGAGGYVIAMGARARLTAALPRNLASMVEVIRFRTEWPVLACAVLLSFAAMLLAGLLPAVSVSRLNLVDVLKTGRDATSARAHWIERGGVVLQIALALLLLSGAAMLVATVRRLSAVETGIDPSQVVVATVETRGTPLASRGIAPIHEAILREVRAVSGVDRVAMASALPFFGGRFSRERLAFTGDPPDQPRAQPILTAITPEYFDTNGVRMIAGRAFASSDTSSGPGVAIVNAALAGALGGEAAVIGRELRLGSARPRLVTVIGVAADTKLTSLRSAATPICYVPVAQSSDWPFLGITVRSSRPAGDLLREVPAAILRAAPDVQVRNLTTMAAEIRASMVREEVAAALAAIFGAIALGLVSVGIYGVMAQHVASRTAELGVRAALGARRADLLALVLRSSLRLVIAGMTIGTPLAIAAGYAISSELFGVRPFEPVMLGGSIAVLFFAAITAVFAPALRAAKADPLASLKTV